MKISILFPLFLFVQCTNNQVQESITFCTDTVYIETEPTIEKKPWDLACFDEAETNLDINLCSLERFYVADSLFDEQYTKLMNRLDKGIKETYVPIYHEDLKRQKRRIRSLFYEFNNLEIALERLISHSLGDARLSPLICNSYLLSLKAFQIQLFADLEEEVIHNF